MMMFGTDPKRLGYAKWKQDKTMSPRCCMGMYVPHPSGAAAQIGVGIPIPCVVLSLSVPTAVGGWPICSIEPLVFSDARVL